MVWQSGSSGDAGTRGDRETGGQGDASESGSVSHRPHPSPVSSSSVLLLAHVPFVMVGDDQVDAALAGDAGGFDGGDAAVDADNQPGSLLANLLDRLGVQAITFFQPMRNVEIDHAAEVSDGVPENGAGGDAVDVVVAVDDDLLLVANGPGHALGRLGEARNAGRIMQALQARPQKFMAILRLMNAAIEQKLCDYRRSLQARSQFLGAGASAAARVQRLGLRIRAQIVRFIKPRPMPRSAFYAMRRGEPNYSAGNSNVIVSRPFSAVSSGAVLNRAEIV